MVRRPEPLQNRVTPFGDIIADPARGALMGNRGGRIHDPATRTLTPRRWASRQWICCLTLFGERRRAVMGPGYTELFFLDEVTALAAGHRPCFECRRDAARAFAAALAAGRGEGRRPAGDIDRLLHAERLEGRGKRIHQAALATLPDGAMIAVDGEAFAVSGDRLLAWTPAGYGRVVARPSAGTAAVLTPASAVAALSAGYRPLWHETATR